MAVERDPAERLPERLLLARPLPAEQEERLGPARRAVGTERERRRDPGRGGERLIQRPSQRSLEPVEPELHLLVLG